MQKINYGLIVSDFDGTLVRKNGEISEENKQAIAQYRVNGGHFAISTGRMHYDILSLAKELGLHGLVSCCQGALIMDIDSGKPVLNGTLSHEVTLAVCRKMEEMDLHYHVYEFDNYYCNKDDEALKAYENAVKTKAKLVTDKPLSAFVEERKIRAYKVLAMVNAKDHVSIMQTLEEMHFSGCSVTKSADVLVEVINASYSKGTAVEFLADYYGVDLEKTIAVGDQMNDIPMIKKAGLGIAVGNADALLKEVAYVLAHTHEQSAIAKIIEQFGYTEE